MNPVARFFYVGLPLFLALGVSAAVAVQQESDRMLEALIAAMPSNRLTVVVVPLENRSHDVRLDHWRFTAASVLLPYLGEAKGLRLIPQSSLVYGLAKIGKRPGDVLNAGEAARLGELVEARRVVWGSYAREGSKWLVSVQIINVSDGRVSKPLEARSADWFEIRDDLGKQILKELHVTPSRLERRKMEPHWTRSAATCEWLGKARMAVDDHRPAAEWQDYAKFAAEADPACAEAMVAWAAAEVAQGKTEAGIAPVKLSAVKS